MIKDDDEVFLIFKTPLDSGSSSSQFVVLLDAVVKSILLGIWM